jgi:hypothetical protein
MFKNTSRSIIAIIGLTLFSFAFALPTGTKGWENIAGAGIKIMFPDNWKVSQTDGTVAAISPDAEVEVYAFTVEHENLEAALAELGKEIEKYATDVQVKGEPKLIKVNGFDAVDVDAKGKVDGKDYDLGLLLLLTPTGKVMILFGEGAPASLKKYEADLGKIITSIAGA